MLLLAEEIFARQIVLNIIMTIPFGFLLPLIKKRKY